MFQTSEDIVPARRQKYLRNDSWVFLWSSVFSNWGKIVACKHRASTHTHICTVMGMQTWVHIQGTDNRIPVLSTAWFLVDDLKVSLGRKYIYVLRTWVHKKYSKLIQTLRSENWGGGRNELLRSKNPLNRKKREKESMFRKSIYFKYLLWPFIFDKLFLKIISRKLD